MKIKKGEYVVVLHDDAYSNNWKNYCFKQRDDKEDFVFPEACPNHPKNNTQESYNVRESHRWRYATPEEIARYDQEGFFLITSEPVEKKQVAVVSNYEIY
jgi:hypothetical protein